MIASTGATILGVLYIALLGRHLVLIPHRLRSNAVSAPVVVLLSRANGFRRGAYYIGRAIGKHKLAPSISPGKTWEGAVGGVVQRWRWRRSRTSGSFVNFRSNTAAARRDDDIVGIFGDLAESALKRSASAKDAANILPGHGGILDRLDSLLFNAPLIYYFAVFYFKADRLRKSR